MEGLADSFINEKMVSEAYPILENLVEMDGKSIGYLQIGKDIQYAGNAFKKERY